MNGDYPLKEQFHGRLFRENQKEEFRAASTAKGSNMSAEIRMFIIRSIDEYKKINK